MSSSNYQYSDKYISITIHKPVYGTFCYLRKEYITKAIATNRMLLVTIPQGTYEIDPKDWLKNSVPHEQVFLRPDEPMQLLGNHVVHAPAIKKVEKNVQIKLF